MKGDVESLQARRAIYVADTKRKAKTLAQIEEAKNVAFSFRVPIESIMLQSLRDDALEFGIDFSMSPVIPSVQCIAIFVYFLCSIVLFIRL